MGNTTKVISCLKALNFAPSIEEFEHRLLIQKLVYLLQLKGIKCGFAYSLYIRGPYSPDLTKEIYARKADLEKLKSDLALSPEEEKTVSRLKQLIGLKPSPLEVAATYAFFVTENGMDPTTAVSRVKKLKPFISEPQVAIAISNVKKFLS